MSNIIEFKIIDFKSQINPKGEDSPAVWQEKEDIVAETQNGQRLYLTRFRYIGDIPILCEEDCIKKNTGAVYQGELKKSQNTKYNDTIESIHWIDTWGGAPNPFCPQPDVSAKEERQASILAQSDLHTAAPMAALRTQEFPVERADEIYGEMLLRYARLAGKARKQLTKEYLEEKKQEASDENKKRN